MMDPSFAPSTASSRRIGPRNTIAQVEVANIQYLKEAPRYLIAGAVLGCLGFLVCVVPWFARMAEYMYNDHGIQKADVPATVSEMVSVWDTTEARVFFGFELMAAVLILLSWYPFKMRNACCIPTAGGCCLKLCGMRWSWASFRQFCPSIGLVLVACCPTVKVIYGAGCILLTSEKDCQNKAPDFCTWNSTALNYKKLPEIVLGACVADDMNEEAKSTFAELVLIAVHGIAALMMFVAFLLAEAHVLAVKIPFTNYAPFYCSAREEAKPSLVPGSPEYKYRLITWWFGFVFYNTFCVWTVVLSFRPLDDPSRKMNFCSFLSEVIAGLAMLGNHIVIWYYSNERKWEEEVLDRIENHTQMRLLAAASPAGSAMALELPTISERNTDNDETFGMAGSDSA